MSHMHSGGVTLVPGDPHTLVTHTLMTHTLMTKHEPAQ